MPDRPKPRKRRRKEKRTEGQPVKKSHRYFDPATRAEVISPVANGSCGSSVVVRPSLDRSASMPGPSTSKAAEMAAEERNEVVDDGIDEPASDHDGCRRRKMPRSSSSVVAPSPSLASVASLTSQETVDSGYIQSSQETLATEEASQDHEIVRVSEGEEGNGGNEKSSKQLDCNRWASSSSTALEESRRREEEFRNSRLEPSVVRREAGYTSSSSSGSVASRLHLQQLSSRLPTVGTSRPELLCNFCLSRDKNAGIIHGSIIHQICCYPCAKRLYKRRQPCPMCRRRIEKISKIIVG